MAATGRMRLYKSYMFRGKDPVIDEVRTLVQQEFGELSIKQLQAIEDAGGPSMRCMYGWFFGDTKRPQNPTIEAAGRAMGYKRRWVKSR